MTTTKAQALAAKIAAAKATSGDMNETVQAGDYEPPAAGRTPARLVEYIEMGKHSYEYQGKPKTKDTVELVFELIGKKHPPVADSNGVLKPVRITVRENKNQSEKANWRKLFAMMNYSGKATHMAEFLGEAFLVEVFHTKSQDGKRTYANLRDESGYRVSRPVTEDPDTGELRVLNVGPQISELKAFFWEHADLDDWNALFIAGQTEERKDEKTGEVIAPARSRNYRQEIMQKASNWAACPVSTLIKTGGADDGIDDGETVAAQPDNGGASADPLAAL